MINFINYRIIFLFMYESIGLKKELKNSFNSFKGKLKIIYPNELKEFSSNDVIKFFTEILEEENLCLFMECKKTFLKNNPSSIDITNADLLKRIMEYYK